MPDSPIIQTTGLCYSFQKGTRILDNVSLEVPQGSVYGFLGPNGAGKTTTLRLLLGLLRRQEGTLKVFGKDIDADRMDILRRLGSMIEQPSLYLHLTAKENLDIYRLIYKVPKTRVEEGLRIVGLDQTGKKKARQFSLGMKQRLSIAIALLHQPELLILDEPTNGLDPNGIIETRELIRQLNREHNTSVLVSSHILNEIERMATHVGIIHKGRLLFQGSLGELQQMKTSKVTLELETSDNERAIRMLSGQFKIVISETNNDKIIISAQERDNIARISRSLIQEGIELYELHSKQSDLEQIFIDITSSDNR